MEAIKKPGRPVGTTKVRLPILKDEYETLMMHLNQSVVKHSIRERLRLSFFLLKEFGFRCSEVLQITYNMIDQGIEEGKFSLTNSTKTKTPRLVLVTKEGREGLKVLFEKYNDIEDRSTKIFLKKNGKELKSASFTKLLNSNIKAALGELFSSHSFRSGLISSLFNSGAPASVIAEIISHSNIQTTLKYHHSTEESLLDALEKLKK